MHHDDSLFIIDLPRHWRQARLWGALAAVALAGCPVPGPMPQRDAGATPDVPLRPTDDASVDAPRPSPARLEVSPASLIVSAALDEVIEQTFEFTFVDELGVRATLPGTDVLLALDDPRMGTIDATGHFASGPRSTGTAQLTATYRARTLNVPIEIRRSDVVLAGGATAADADFFETLATDPALEVGVVYPLDGVVMPQDAAPMEIQWTRGALADLYRIRFTAPHAEFTVLYREVTHRRAWRVDASLFRLLAQADPNEPIAVAVDRFDAASGRAIEGAPRAIRFAPGVLRGNVYYWDASSSGLRRIAHGGTTAEVVDTGGRCVGCHAISPDGHTIAVRYDASSGPGGFVDVATGTSRDAVGWYFASFAPTGDRLIVDTASMALELVDVETGSFVAAASAMLPPLALGESGLGPERTLHRVRHQHRRPLPPRLRQLPRRGPGASRGDGPRHVRGAERDRRCRHALLTHPRPLPRHQPAHLVTGLLDDRVRGGSLLEHQLGQRPLRRTNGR
jgi:hypothetical protein